VIFFHAAIRTAPDYLTRREDYRKDHLARLLALRDRGLVVAGGPAPDGARAGVFYRTRSEADLARLVEEDPYFTGGAWTGYEARAFAEFLEPWRPPPVVTDGSRRVTVVEGPTGNTDMASFALIDARGAGRLAFGGLFPGGETLAVMATPDPVQAVEWLVETGLWERPSLRTRPFLYAL
jgi:hypothetical protein